MSRDGRGLRRLALGWLVLGMLTLAAGALLVAAAWWFTAYMFCGGLIARRTARGGRPPDRWRRPRAEDWTRMLQRRR